MKESYITTDLAVCVNRFSPFEKKNIKISIFKLRTFLTVLVEKIVNIY